MYLDMRIEWCKARARALRWSEEVDLLMEEMRRTLEFFQWDALRWAERMSFQVASADVASLEGHRAYAHRQATLRKSLVASCRCSWTATMEFARQVENDCIDDDETTTDTLTHRLEELSHGDTIEDVENPISEA